MRLWLFHSLRDGTDMKTGEFKEEMEEFFFFYLVLKLYTWLERFDLKFTVKNKDILFLFVLKF